MLLPVGQVKLCKDAALEFHNPELPAAGLEEHFFGNAADPGASVQNLGGGNDPTASLAPEPSPRGTPNLDGPRSPAE